MNTHATPGPLPILVPTPDELRSSLEPHIGTMEELGCLPDVVVGKLRDLGVFRMFAPKQFGGLELDFPISLELIRRIAMVDASIAWVAAINSGGCLILPKMTMASLDKVYHTGPDQIVAGSAQAQGIGTRVPGGWRVTGRWPLASGCKAANWILAGFKNGAADASESAPMQAMLLPAKEFVIEETWHAMGLRGTGSHHISIENAFVGDGFVFMLGGGELSIDAPLYRHPSHLIALMHGAVQLGIAQAAVADIVEMQKDRLASNGTGRRELIYFELGECDVRLRAAEAAFERQVNSNWLHALDNGPPDPSKLAATIQTAVYIASETLAVVRRCFEIGGSASVYDTCPLQRRLRDIQVATQHGLVQRANFMAGGKVLIERVETGLRNNVLFEAR